jgi:superfamily II DNA or RNA helicase
MRTNLLPHNRLAYQMVMQSLSQNDRTCIVHPTGTGKSYLTAAVSEKYKRILILAPNNFAIDEVKKVTYWHKGIDYMTYSLLMYRGASDNYDLIVLDEFHRAGADMWGDAVKRLISENPQAKVLGTSATPVRFLDKERDMAVELFDGNIASQMSLGEAWSRNILPIPTYVTGLFDFSTTAKETSRKIEESQNLSSEEKAQRLKMLHNIELEWQTSHGMPAIIRKYVRKDVYRVIVFCNDLKSLRQLEYTVKEWFDSAGIPIDSINYLHHKLSDKKKAKAMADFKTDSNKGAKIILAVNMLNESVHIPNVDVVIMLRTTASRIIYLQQLGRCLSAANAEKPVVLDMVDNISSTSCIHDISNEFELREVGRAKMERREPRTFTIYDHMQEIRDIVSNLELGIIHVPVETRVANLRQFVSQHGRLPKRVENKDYRNYSILRAYHREEIEDIIQTYGKPINKVPIETRIANLRQFISKNGRVPKKKDDGDDYNNWQYLYCHQRNEISDILEIYGRPKPNFDEVIKEYIEFCHKNGRKPKRTSADSRERYLDNFYFDHKDAMLEIPEVRKYIELYGREMSIEIPLQKLREFYETHHRKPSKADGDIYYKIYRKLKYDERPEVKAFFESVKHVGVKNEFETMNADERFQAIEEFCEEHQRTPVKADGDIYTLYRYIKNSIHKNDERLKAIIDKYHITGYQRVTERLAAAVEFCERNNRLPNKSNDLRKLIDHYPDHPIVKQLYQKYGK